jgi:Metallo-peptidase family M12B Reprolysin-like
MANFSRTAFLSVVAAGALALGSGVACGQQVWTNLAAMPRSVEAGPACVRPEKFAAFALDRRSLAAVLATAPREFAQGGRAAAIVSIPMPDGSLAKFEVVESSVMADDLAAKYPAIRTYLGQGVDRPLMNLRFDVTPHGFHGSILSPEGEVYIDPYTLRDDVHYVSYYTRDHAASRRPFVCTTPGAEAAVPMARELQPGRSGAHLRTYRLAASMTGEATTTFSQQQGRAANVSDGLAAMVTIINRANQILETEVAVRGVLISGTDLRIFTNAATDPFSNPGDATGTNSNHSSYLSSNVGFANFDFAHVIHTGGDFGNAGAIGTACSATSKGLGMSSANPVPLDNLVVKLVCHEMGHQFGANHSFNSCSGGQSPAGPNSLEPGGGSTIMGYVGICSASENLQTAPDPMYNSGAYDQMIAYTTTGTGSPCPVVTATGNAPPGIDAGPNFAIPKSTPFTLTAIGADADGHALTYSWEDRSSGAPLAATAPDNNANPPSPLVRVRMHTASPSRTIPPMASILAGTSVIGERLPLFARTWNFRATARDSRAGGGGVATDDIVLSVQAAGPFRVTGPTAGSVNQLTTTVTWDVAGTNAAPISTENVRILCSVDGGATFPHVLAESTPNDGSVAVILPNVASSQARIKIEPIGNVYFAVSPGNFTVQAVPPGVILSLRGAITVSDLAGNCNRNGFVDPGESGIGLMIPVTNTGGTTGTQMVGTLTALTPGVEVLSAAASYGDVAYAGVSTNATPFLIRVPQSHSCGSAVALRLTMAHAMGSNVVDVSVPAWFASPPMNVNYAGARQIIPNPGAREIALSVAGVPALIHDVRFSILGSACTDAQGSVTAGLAHTAVNQLLISLRDPSGLSVLLWNQNGGNGGGPGTRGDNLCNTVFSDDAAVPASALGLNDAPYTGTWRPAAPLSAFGGRLANGNWVVRFEDSVALESGTVLAFGVTIRHRICAATRCPADQDNGSGAGLADGAVTIEDLLYFLTAFEGGNSRIDLDDGSGQGRPDGAVTIDDLLAYLIAFENGC